MKHYLALTLLLSQLMIAQSTFWQSVGSLGYPITDISINQNGTIFAGTYGGGVFLSTDRGSNWLRSNIGLQDALWIHSLASDGPSNVFLGTYGFPNRDGAIFRTTNNGTSWDKIISDSIRGSVRSLVINRLGYIFAVTAEESGLGDDFGRVIRSTNQGLSWTTVDSISGYFIYVIAVDNQNTLFAGIWGTPGIKRSTDHGASWQITNIGLSNVRVYSLGVDSSNRIYAGTRGGIFISSDGGSNWNLVKSGTSATTINDFTINACSHVFASNLSGVLCSTDTGLTWQPLTTGLSDTLARCLALDRDGFVYVGTGGGGIFRSSLTTSAIPQLAAALPQGFSLSQNFPNPFNHTTIIRFSVPTANFVSLKLLDLNGHEVSTLVNQFLRAGTHNVRWSASSYATGVYFCRLQADRYSDSKKLLLIK